MVALKNLMAALVAVAAAGEASAHNVPKGHWAAAVPDFDRVNAHGRRLSAACLAKGRTLEETCPLDPEVTAGPYVWDEAPIRANITEDRGGVPFEIQLTVVNSTTCEEIDGAAVEFWHCDADGIYSHFIEESTNTGSDTDNSTFLRGIQYTNETGTVVVQTIFPGWYEGRTTHVHVRVHFNITETDGGEDYTGGTVSHVGQLFFDDDKVAEIQSTDAYADNTASVTLLDDDSIYTGQDGTYGLMTLTEMYPGEGLTSGVIGFVTVGVDTYETDETVDGGAGGDGAPSGGAPSGGGPGGDFNGTFPGSDGGSPPDGSGPGASTSAPTTVADGAGSPTMWPTNAPSSAVALRSSVALALMAALIVL